jgi:hypothetical protein
MTQKERRKNNPLHKLIKLDKEDRHLLKERSWHLDTDGYAQISIIVNTKRVTRRIHRFILPDKVGFEVDHINRNILDNRRCNLRYVTHQQNMMNCSKYKNNTSGYRGVSWSKQNKKWQAQIEFNKKNIHLGCFNSAKEAAKSYQIMAKKLFGEYAGALEAEKLTGKKIKR